MNSWILISLAFVCITSNLVLESTSLKMSSIIDWANLSCILRFIAPQYDSDQWNEIDREVKRLTSPVHFGLANNVVTPQDAAMQFSEKMYNLLKLKRYLNCLFLLKSILKLRIPGK